MMQQNGKYEIELDRVNLKFGDFVAVRDLSFAVKPGEIVALVGRTGAGKSTALNLVMGNLAPDTGRVRVSGLDPARDFQQLRGRLAVSFQTDRLLPWRTAVENVELGMQILRYEKNDCRIRALHWLERVKMDGAEHKYPHALSGGMRQRVSLARALAVDPKILLLDESFSQLDHMTSRALRADISELIRELEKTCLFITHRIDDAIDMADRVLVLSAPAHVALEALPTAEDRGDPERLAQLHNRVAGALDDQIVN